MPGTAAFRRSVEEHAAALAPLLAPLRERAAETIPLEAAHGRATTGDVVTPVPLPLFRNSQMDGVAVRSADVARAPVLLRLSAAESAAGAGSPPPLVPGMAMRIMTGAPMPAGADAVIPVEETKLGDGVVEILRARGAGEYVREPGSDLPAGATLLAAGTRLGSRQLAALAAAGLDRVAVRSRPRIAVISTGSELVAPGERPRPGELFDANGVALAAAIVEAGGAVVHRARVRDEPERLRAELDAALAAGAELVVTSGGVSMGEHEVVRETLEPAGALVGSVAMQPGGPQGHGEWRGAPVLCFPGNPVSSQLSLELFLAPLLREIAALPAARVTRERVAGPIRSVAGKRQYLRGRRAADGRVAPLGGPGSHLVAALAAAELLLVVPEEAVELTEDETVEVRWLS